MRGKVVYDRRGAIRFYLDDREVGAEEYAAAFPSRLEEIFESGQTAQGQFSSGWPMRSEALAVHPKQVEQANARNKRMGLHTRYDEKGVAHIPDRGERKRLLRVEGMHDNEGCYGD